MAWIDTQLTSTPVEDEKAMRDAIAYFAEIRRIETEFNEDDALNLANFARMYPQASNEMMVAVATSKLPYDLPELRDLVAREADVGGNLLTKINDKIKWGSRNTLAVADTIYENGIGRPARFALGLAQGSDIEESWRTSGSTVLEEMVAATRRGEDYTLGEGFFAQPQKPQDSPQYLEAFQAENALQPQPSTEGLMAAHEAGVAAMPVDTARISIERNEQRVMHKTVNGQQYDVPFSLGRAVAMQIVRPETVPFSIISGAMDAPMRVGLDPLNIPADELTRYLKSRRLLVPDLDDVVTTPGLRSEGALGRFVGDENIIKVASDEEIAASWHNLTADIAGRQSRLDDALRLGDQSPEAIQVMTQSIDELAFIQDRVGRIAAKTKQNPESVYRQFVVAHERGHQLHDSIRHGAPAEVDELSAAFGSMLGTPRETQASSRAFEILDRRPTRAARDLKLYSEAGITASWRPYAQPTRVNEWLKSRRGQRIVNYLTEEQSISHVRKVIGDLPIEDIRRVTLAKDPEAVGRILRTHLGRSLPEAPRLGMRPRILGARTMNDADKGAAGGFTLIDEDSSIGTWMRRYFGSETGGGSTILDPMNPEKGMDAIENWLGTVGASVDEIDSVLMRVAEAPNDWDTYVAAVESMNDILKRRLQAMNYSDTHVDRIMGEYLDAQRTAKIYFDDALGRPVFEIGDAPMRITNDAGEVVEWRIPRAAHEAQYHHRSLILPSVRDVRRMSSSIRGVTDKLRVWKGPLGIRQQWMSARLDNVMSVWRNAALLRAGWMLRVLPDELARIAASGYSTDFNPFSYIAMSIGDRGLADVFGRSLNEQAELFGGLGVNSIFRDLRNNPVSSSRFDVSNVTWTPARMGERAHRQGLTRVLTQYNASDLTRRVAEMGVDEAYNFFRSTPEGNQILQDIARGAGGGSPLSRITDPETLMAKLHSLNADLSRYSGGSWISRDPSDPSRWLDMYGQPLADPGNAPLAQIDLELRELGVANRTSRGGRRLTGDERRALLREAKDYPDLGSLPESQQFFVLDPGSDRVRKFIASGVDEYGTESTRIQQLRGVQDLDRYGVPDGVEIQVHVMEHGDAIVYEHYADDINDYANPHASIEDARATMGPDDVAFVTVDGEQYGRYTLKELEMQLPDPERGAAHIVEGMGPDDWIHLEQRIYDMYDDIAPPEIVRAPDPGQANRANRWGSEAVDKLFYYLGTAPTQKLVRSPFFRTRYWEEMARFYVHGDDTIRATIVAAADDAGVGAMFNKHVDKMLSERGIVGLPQENLLGALTLEDMDGIAKRIGVNATRDLLYDLSKSSNAADAMRVVVPFGDAWWEVLSRWASIMNPYRAGGQPIRNFRRGEQLVSQAKQAGWFQEDQYGNETFNVPAWPWLNRTAGWQISGRMSPDQLLFVDPGNARSIMLPGFGFVVQLPTSMVAPHLPIPIRNAARWAVFGDFPPGDTSSIGTMVQSVLPTPYRRAVQAFVGDDYRREYADEIVEVYSALLASGDPRYGDETLSRRDATIEMARTVGSTLARTRILDAALLPGQPRYDAQIRIVEDVLGGKVEPYWLDIAMVGAELRAAEEYFDGDRTKAINYIMERFGFDPLNVAPGSRQVKARPVSEAGFNFLEQNPALERHADFTLMAFIPEGIAAEFFQPAWAAQFVDGTRERYDVESAARVINAQKGIRAYSALTDIFDAKKAEAEAAWGRDSKKYKQYVESLQRWKNAEGASIEVQYWAWGENRNLVGTTERPSYGDYLEEVFDIGNPASSAHKNLVEVSPELVGFYAHVRSLWKEHDDFSLPERTSSWWRTSETVEEGGASEQLRQRFVSGLRYYVNEIMTDPRAKEGAQWLMDRVLGPLMAGYDFDDPILLEVTEPPNLTRAEASDTLTQTEYAPRIEDELAVTNG